MHGDYDVFIESMSLFLGGYYLAIALMNAVAAFYLWNTHRSTTLFRLGPIPVTTALIWLFVSGVFVIIAPLAAGGGARYLRLPLAVEEGINRFMDPTVYSLGSLVILGVLFVFRKFFVKPWVAWTLLNLSLLFMGLSMTNQNFAAIVTKPDNVPIVAMVFLLGFFTWLSAYRAVQNDERMKRGEPPLEALQQEKVLVWPDLVYTELICMVALTAVMILWAISLQAPLEEPASSVKTPNPSKAPWYFLGLQEMLVYYDPWMAGVVLPSLVVFGLMAIPYLDFNKQGNGYYTIEQRKFAYLTFQFGFLVLWVTLIVMGTFLRGPNWNFFGPYEYWDAHKVEAIYNVDLSEYFWINMLGMGRPRAPEGSGELTKLGYILLREAPGILLVLFYLVATPPILAATVMRKFFVRMGFIRFMVLANLLLFMALLPIKMLFRWTANLKYFISIPEYFLNF